MDNKETFNKQFIRNLAVSKELAGRQSPKIEDFSVSCTTGEKK